MIEYYRSSDNEWVIKYNGEAAGIFRYYENIDFECRGVRLDRFLGYIRIEESYRRKGILKRIVEDFGIGSLMVDDIEGMGVDILFRIYSRLGFRLIEGSKQFMIRL